ncbi:MFS transporter [Gephyromycinifex aptenodytis]|uniref:MFS transporter n=1 Tax=Gephyromycinifex aptenodytis TaxID=2716227 RepID=UPI001446C044|nr:MFS transporter [Gephyromycinifex aptenodytis]
MGASEGIGQVRLPPGAQAPVLYATLMLAFMGQMLLNPLIAPLSREMGMKEWHMGATISIAAVMLALTSPYWGKASQRHGAKRTLVTAMGIAMTALFGVVCIAYLGMNGIWVGSSMVIGFMVARGLVYGSAISAVSPTVQTHLVTHTDTEAQRVKAVGGIGAVTGLSSILGAFIGGALAAIGGLMLPLIVMPFLMLIGIVVLAVRFTSEGSLRVDEQPLTVSYRDPRAFPFLISGLLMYIVFSSLATLTGFILQDRFALSPEGTAGVTALYMVMMSVMLIAAQAVFAPKLGWNSVQLLRRGLLIAAVAMVLFIPSHSFVLFGVAISLFGLGTGLAMPGYNAGPTMELSRQEQGSLAGLINSNNGAAFAVAPIGSTALYGLHPTLPLVVCVVLLVLVVAFAYTNPKLQTVAKVAEPVTAL